MRSGQKGKNESIILRICSSSIADGICHPLWLSVLKMKKIIDNETGEVIEETTVHYQLALAELNRLPMVDTWCEWKERLLTATEQLEMVEVPLKETLMELFEKYDIKSLQNEYVGIVRRNGYEKKSWNSKKLEEFIKEHGGNVEDFKDSKWVDGGIQLTYKE